MSVGFPFVDPRARPLDSNGKTQAGCYYCFFLTGTLTPANVYQDGALTTPLSQPTPGSVNPTGGTVSDSAGRFAVMFNDPSVTYRAQLYSAAGVLLEDTDPYKVPGSPSVAFGNGTAAAPGIAFTNFLSTGLYIPSANSLGFATNGLAAGAINQNQAWSIPAANGAVSLTLAGASGFYAEMINGNAASANSFGLQINAGSTSADTALLVQNQAQGAVFLEILGDGSGGIGPNTNNHLVWGTTGDFTITAPTAGTALLVNGLAANNALIVSGSSTSGSSFGLLVEAGTSNNDYAMKVQNQAGSSTYFEVQGNGESFVIEPPAGSAPPTSGHQVGYLEVPFNFQNGNYGLVMTDRGKQVLYNGGGGNTYTIPANGSVAYPVGTTITIVNFSSSSLSIAITTDTLTWMPSKGTGTRTLAAGGIATISKFGATTWYITGQGLT